MRPFHIAIAQESIDDLRDRLDRTRWPGGAEHGWERGVPLGYLQELVRYWRDDYDWRAVEARLNRHPQFITEIDGQRCHFLHVRSPEPDATPLILTHGWPGSFAEYADLIGPLTDPRRHGLDPAIAFHAVVPSLPGFGFSQPLTPGWEPVRIAAAWTELMARLGYDRYLAAGGDAGAVVSTQMGRTDPGQVLGVHVTMLLTFPPQDPAALAGLDAEDQAKLAKMAEFDATLSGYLTIQMNRPQTLAYALTDSPVAQLAWLVERFKDWTDSAEAPEDAVDRDAMLTNASVYWFTASGATSAQLYYEAAEGMRMAFSGFTPPPVTVPVGVATFKHDPFPAIRPLAERELEHIARWTEYDRGGHFPTLERPQELIADIRAFAATVTAGRAAA